MAVGKLREAWVKEGCDEYARRLQARLPLQVIEAKSSAELARRIPPRHRIWALDERGKQMTSTELSEIIRSHMDTGESGIAFLIGGADGLPDELLGRAHMRWSLGRLTLPHRLARLILLEQLYRALSILRGEPYHRE
jgi:23S rRNA (pseudouridine1915-N3)-methyltransferase